MPILLPDTHKVGINLVKNGFLQNVMFPSDQDGSGMPQRNQKALQPCLIYTTNQLVEIVFSYWMFLPIHPGLFPMKILKSFRNSPRSDGQFSLTTLLPTRLSQQAVCVVGWTTCSLHPPVSSEIAYTPTGHHRKGRQAGKCSSTSGDPLPLTCSSCRSLSRWGSVWSSSMWMSYWVDCGKQFSKARQLDTRGCSGSPLLKPGTWSYMSTVHAQTHWLHPSASSWIPSQMYMV